MNLPIRIGMDTSKSVFQLHCVDENEVVVVRRQFRRAEMIRYFERLPAGSRRHRALRQLAPLGAPAAVIRSRGEANPTSICEGLREARQERRNEYEPRVLHLLIRRKQRNDAATREGSNRQIVPKRRCAFYSLIVNKIARLALPLFSAFCPEPDYESDICNLSTSSPTYSSPSYFMKCVCFCTVRNDRQCASILDRLSARINFPPGLVYSSARFSSLILAPRYPLPDWLYDVLGHPNRH
jgi:hypothetical protein